MFRNFILTSLRNFRKNKSYVIINAFGLGIALACCITAYLILAFNFEFDDAFDKEKLSSTFLVHTLYKDQGDQIGRHIIAPVNLGPALAENIAGVESYSRYNSAGAYVRVNDKSFSEGIQFADSTFFEIFEFDLIRGAFSSFNKLNTVVISEEAAGKFFDKENPIGQTIKCYLPNEKEKLFVVGAVFKNKPTNSSIRFHIMARHEHFMDVFNLSSSEWGDWRDPALFVKLSNPDRADEIAPLLTEYVTLRNEMKPDAKVTGFSLAPFNKPMNEDDIGWSMINTPISITPLIVFSSMALMILLIACFNLTNTSFAITARRLKEVGVRKVIGASRQMIVLQFLTEMILTVFLSLIVGLILAKFIAAEFADMWNLGYGLSDLNGVNLVVTLIILIFGSSLLAGLYPALNNSKFMPVELLKSNIKLRGANWFTKTLVTLQFAISVFVLIHGVVFIQNTKFQEAIDFGYDYKKVVTVSINSKKEYDLIRARIMNNPKVEKTAISHHMLGWSSYPFPVSIDTSEYQVQHIEVGVNFFETMGLKVYEGRFLDLESSTDQTSSVVVNKAFLTHCDLSDNSLNTIVTIRGEKKRIVGIIENHVDNLFRSTTSEPFIFYQSKPNEYHTMAIRCAPEDREAVSEELESVWQELFPEKPYFGRYQEDSILSGLRDTNDNLKKIFIFLTILGGLLSVSGIYALASLNVEKRTKEIGVRKALGASIRSIVMILSREFAIILGLAVMLGSVGGYFLSTMLLDEIYAYHISVGAFPLVFSSFIIFSMGILTTGWIITKAALANPVHSLRDE
ncbi:MAG: ABC transporter permease [Cyclobacteriaceae bacterium]